MRHNIPYGQFTWEIDFFYEDENILPYFVMAEVELPENLSAPPYIPDFIKENLLYEVPVNDNRFYNVKLRDIEYTKKIYQELLNGVNNEEKI